MDCRTCKHNTYIGVTSEWVSCSHPTTQAKAVRYQSGDPAWVNMLTGDVPVSRIDELKDCPTYEAVEADAHDDMLELEQALADRDRE